MKNVRIKNRILLPLLVIAMLAFSLKTSAKVYYVDSILGNDSETGTVIKNAWKSLINVNSRNF